MKKILISGFLVTIATVIVTSIFSTKAIVHAFAYQNSNAVLSTSEVKPTSPSILKPPITSNGDILMSGSASAASLKTDNSTKITVLQNQYAQLQAQYEPLQRIQNTWKIGLQEAQSANVAGYSNTLSQDDTNMLGTYYANLFRPQSSGSFQGELASFEAEAEVTMQKNQQKLSSLQAQMLQIQSQIKSLQ